MQQIKVGIDAGGSLVKIAYQDNKRMQYKKYQLTELDQAMTWLKMISPGLKVALTGGRAEFIQKKHFSDALIIPEFQATCVGALTFLAEEGKKINEPFLLINIGTGTSWHLVNRDKYERILGSGIGGGAFTGLGSLLTSVDEYHKLTQLAVEGEKGNIDLLVKDIYELAEAPINGNLTAANFAKGKKVQHSDADRMAALANMVAETLALLTMQAARIHQVKNAVFVGSALVGNPALRNRLEFYFNMVGLSHRFLLNGEYCGAMGAYSFI
ncbi:type II pantothenate kinase [Neobacillus sp. FSL H8-0543]|uniref:type II pantothenate kinase n=1 Tax=Neobacillus sp. FSL H8-0543 TaxID=2954672 RepID=UPI003158F930